jgi:hypothetical protein
MLLILIAIGGEIYQWGYNDASQPAPATSTGTMTFHGEEYSYTCNGNVCEGVKLTPISTDTESGETSLNVPSKWIPGDTESGQVNPPVPGAICLDNGKPCSQVAPTNTE